MALKKPLVKKPKSQITDAQSPDFSTCAHCEEGITWDDWSYVHMNGWADCGVVMSGGTKISSGITINPDVKATLDTRAEPVEWFEEE